MPQHKSRYIFTTLTFKDGKIPTGFLDSLRTLLSKKFNTTRHVVVEETGSYGKNNHLHLYMELVRERRTDSITRTFKSLYVDVNYVNRYTVRTQVEPDPIYRLGYYFVKEPDYVLHYAQQLSLEAYVTAYNERKSRSQSLITTKNNTKYTINQLPSAYLAYCDSKSLERTQYLKNMSNMIRDGYITCTQLRHLKTVVRFVEVLLGDDLVDFDL